jgi:hypothetical protein
MIHSDAVLGRRFALLAAIFTFTASYCRGQSHSWDRFILAMRRQTTMKMTAFWDTAMITLRMEAYAPLRCQSTSMRLHDAISHKAITFILFAVRT